jgi:type II secretory pathway component PulC
LEVGGKGAALSLGELVDGYRIIQIMNNKVVFKKDGK